MYSEVRIASGARGWFVITLDRDPPVCMPSTVRMTRAEARRLVRALQKLLGDKEGK